MRKILVVTIAAMMLTACGAKPVKLATIPPKDQSIAELNCDKNLATYKLADTPVQFCYEKAWGEPVVTKLKAEVGSGEVVTFGTADNVKAPKIWLATKDFKPTNPADTAADFTSINGMIADANLLKKQVKDATGYDEKDISARKTDVSGVRSVRADVGGKVEQIIYYVRDAFEGYNMVISGGKDIAEAVDNLIFGMVL